jgi:RNA 2',3'-cyclic 3'-phosphodiesterase
MADSWRLFVGIALDEPWTARLDSVADGLRTVLGRSVRWVRPELYHVTVVFLGSQPADAVDPIADAIASAAATVQPFELLLRETVRFGRHENGALVAAVDDPSGALQVMRARLDGELRRRGVRFDARPLSPHVTLARPKRGAGALPQTSVDLRGAPPLLVRKVNLVRSTLLPTGSQYQTIATAPVG